MHIISILASSCLIGAVLAKREVVPPTGDCGANVAEGQMMSCGDQPGHCQYQGKPWPSCLMKDDKNIGHEFCDAAAGYTIIIGPTDGKHYQEGGKCSELVDPNTNAKYRWGFSSYQWDCCKCPKGFRPAGVYNPRTDGHGSFTYNYTTAQGMVERSCMRCTEKGEVLTWNPQIGDFYCKTGGATPTKTHTKTSHTTATHTPTGTGQPGGNTGSCKLNAAGYKLIESYTGQHPSFYTWDDTQMIGYGHNCTLFADCTKISPPLSDAQAVTLLTSDMAVFEKCVKALPNSSGLNSNQFAALVAFASSYYQSCESMTSAFTALMSKKDFAGVCTALRTTGIDDDPFGQMAALRGWQADLCDKATTVKSGC